MSEFESLITEDLVAQIKSLYNKITISHEFEFMFYNFNNVLMSYEKYVLITKYLKARGNMEPTDVLDIIYSVPDEHKSYRISISGVADINRYMKMVHRKKNHVIFSVFASMILGGDKKLTIMSKTKEAENVVDVNDINVRVRLAEEAAVTKDELEKLTSIDRDKILNIIFRLKYRITSQVTKAIKIDLTTTHTTKNFNRIEFTIPNYELELECAAAKPDEEILTGMFEETMKLLKLLQQSNFVITKTKTDKVLEEYAKILSLDRAKLTNLDARQSFSLEIQHVTEVLPNRYAVTDKADGDRYMLIIVNFHVYLISVNLVVRDSGIDIPSDMGEYNGTILDGELIFLPKKNKHIYMVFDCLFRGINVDVRKQPKFVDRIAVADGIIENCFVLGKKQSFYRMKLYVSKEAEFSLGGILKFHGKQMGEYMDDLNKNIDDKATHSFPLVRRKYFIDALGAKPWEIFAYAVLMNEKYTQNSEFGCPYLLDGLILQPLDQPYVTSVKESKYVEYKWKPPTKNSIDFFIQFEKDSVTGKILTIYDNSVDEYVRNKPYRICNLHVGQRTKVGEQPVLFREEEELYKAYIFLDRGEVRDLDGNIIVDKTVVEFYYNSDADVENKFRWIPIRTRYDKTESVLRYRRRYGNYFDVANKIWRSMINPILISDFQELAKGGDIYEKKINNLRSKIGHELIISTAKENIYYQLRTNLAKPMRQFHNWIKSIIIYTYCHPMYQKDRQLSVLDIACGRGGDIMKFYYAKCAFYVGIDIDLEGLMSAVDGAVSRYRQLRKSHPNFPEMNFIQADAGSLLNFEDQNRVFGGMNNENKKLMDKYFSPSSVVQFDRINCQFAVHYFFKNPETWGNFKQNLNMFLKRGGYFMTTVFDARRIMALFKDNSSERYTVTYTSQKGEKKILFEIIKRYDDERQKNIKTGNAIDVHAAWMFKEGQYATEYLVEEDFIVSELQKDCELDLVDTDLFDNQYEIHREYFKNYAKLDENAETRKFLLNVAGFYEFNEVNGGCFKYSRLERYYVFRKRDTEAAKGKKSKKVVQKGGIDQLMDSGRTIVHDLDLSEVGDYTYCGSILHVLKTHKLIPKNVTMKEFLSDFNIGMTDDKLDDDRLQDINQRLVINHEVIPTKKLHVLNGVGVIIVEKDCNSNYDVTLLNDANAKKILVLLKENDIFRPIYYDSNGKIKGLFSDGDEFVKEMGF
ncbi:MAG: mRNA capping enzyme [Hyperionvirus sp.]|uniref:mRNA capping enzyme n=1 Tax=Hyperionvirus sp. TaxID=2487770 RepID=A0A3G5A8H2_9VIRU|nr:MAG: mRNA capping enzyme [Hyperionvirus sp.]